MHVDPLERQKEKQSEIQFSLALCFFSYGALAHIMNEGSQIAAKRPPEREHGCDRLGVIAAAVETHWAKQQCNQVCRLCF